MFMGIAAANIISVSIQPFVFQIYYVLNTKGVQRIHLSVITDASVKGLST